MTKFNLSDSQSTRTDNSDLSLTEIIYLLRRHLPLIAGITSTIFIITILYTLVQIPTYTSTSMVVIDNKSKSGAMFDIGMESNISLMNSMNNEIELLKSRTLSEEVVHDLWNSSIRNNLFLFGTKTYRPEGIKKTIRGLWDSIFNRGNRARSYTQNTEISDSLLFQSSRIIRSSLSVSAERNSDVLKISMTSNDPDESSLLANTVAQLYQQRDMEWSAGEIVNLRDFLQEQLKNVEFELISVEESLRQFQEQEQIFELEGNAQQLLNQLGSVEIKYKTILAEINIIQENRRFIDSKLSQEEKTLKRQLLNSIDTRLLALRTEIAKTEANLVRNRSTYGDDHEAVLSLERKLVRLRVDLEEQTNQLIAGGTSVANPLKYRQALIDTSLFLESRLANFQSQAEEYRKIVNQYNRDLNTLPAKSLEFAQLERDRSVLAQTYALMRKKYEEARITEASQLGKIRIIDPAVPSPSRTSPNTKVNLALGLILGLGLGALAAFFIEQIDNSIKNVSDIERMGIKILGIIPDISKSKSATKIRNNKRKTNKTPDGQTGFISAARDIKRRIITKEDPQSPISEAYRSLRASLTYASVDNQAKTIIITSPGPGEGKTTTITNLAITFANIGKRTLLVDADLRRPVIHRIFNLNIEPGLTQYLTESTRDIDSLIKQTEIINLHVITAGATPSDPSGLLSSEKMHKFLKNLEIGWDIILFDAPPSIAFSDVPL
ncbi:MAG: polysaccharide biosynthesis tyrosine autokinase, partial [Candidatus Marinimicrobia bacterium]|nr:polysaccharide biosynthesis tyrosine autokinase [Candidatus Neomarinimicrobiota bacterium]